MVRKKENKKPETGIKKKIGMAFGFVLLLTLAACTSRETLQLEEDELVYMQEQDCSEGAVGQRQEDEAEQAYGQPPEDEAETSLQQSEENALKQEASTLFVHICGEVRQPGVYELPAQSRIYEAVEAAGGFTDEASQSYVNLAQRLTDGCKIKIPALGQESECTGGTAAGIEFAGADSSEAELSGSQSSKSETPVNINTATKAQLCSLPGIGESRAESIIAYREKNGGFSKTEDIMRVEGIKEGMFSKIKDKICVRGVE